MKLFHYCYFDFRDDSGTKHHLRIRVTSTMGLEYTLYINDSPVAVTIDENINIALPEQLEAALSYANVLRMYRELLSTYTITDGHI